MRGTLILAVLSGVLFGGFVARAEALTIRDVIELSRAGLGEDVLLALIEVDAGIYPIEPSTLKALKEAGVSEKVIVALIRSGRERLAPEPPLPPVQAAVDEPAPQPQVVVIEHHEPAQVREVMVPVPVYVAVPTTRHRRTHDVIRTTETTYVPFQSGMPATRPSSDHVTRPSSTYWGFGGKLRPDAWGQPQDRQRGKHDGEKPREKK